MDNKQWNWQFLSSSNWYFMLCFSNCKYLITLKTVRIKNENYAYNKIENHNSLFKREFIGIIDEILLKYYINNIFICYPNVTCSIPNWQVSKQLWIYSYIYLILYYWTIFHYIIQSEPPHLCTEKIIHNRNVYYGIKSNGYSCICN